jgi:hypothetical protein
MAAAALRINCDLPRDGVRLVRSDHRLHVAVEVAADSKPVYQQSMETELRERIMWSKENKPPVGYNLPVRVGCPECSEPLHFLAPIGERKQVYCANQKCPLMGVDYFILLNGNGCQVVEIA